MNIPSLSVIITTIYYLFPRFALSGAGEIRSLLSEIAEGVSFIFRLLQGDPDAVENVIDGFLVEFLRIFFETVVEPMIIFFHEISVAISTYAPYPGKGIDGEQGSPVIFGTAPEGTIFYELQNLMFGSLTPMAFVILLLVFIIIIMVSLFDVGLDLNLNTASSKRKLMVAPILIYFWMFMANLILLISFGLTDTFSSMAGSMELTSIDGVESNSFQDYVEGISGDDTGLLEIVFSYMLAIPSIILYVLLVPLNIFRIYGLFLFYALGPILITLWALGDSIKQLSGLGEKGIEYFVLFSLFPIAVGFVEAIFIPMWGVIYVMISNVVGDVPGVGNLVESYLTAYIMLIAPVAINLSGWVVVVGFKKTAAAGGATLGLATVASTGGAALGGAMATKSIKNASMDDMKPSNMYSNMKNKAKVAKRTWGDKETVRKGTVAAEKGVVKSGFLSTFGGGFGGKTIENMIRTNAEIMDDEKHGGLKDILDPKQDDDSYSKLMDKFKAESVDEKNKEETMFDDELYEEFEEDKLEVLREIEEKVGAKLMKESADDIVYEEFADRYNISDVDNIDNIEEKMFTDYLRRAREGTLDEVWGEDAQNIMQKKVFNQMDEETIRQKADEMYVNHKKHPKDNDKLKIDRDIFKEFKDEKVLEIYDDVSDDSSIVLDTMWNALMTENGTYDSDKADKAEQELMNIFENNLESKGNVDKNDVLTAIKQSKYDVSDIISEFYDEDGDAEIILNSILDHTDISGANDKNDKEKFIEQFVNDTDQKIKNNMINSDLINNYEKMLLGLKNKDVNDLLSTADIFEQRIEYIEDLDDEMIDVNGIKNWNIDFNNIDDIKEIKKLNKLLNNDVDSIDSEELSSYGFLEILEQYNLSEDTKDEVISQLKNDFNVDLNEDMPESIKNLKTPAEAVEKMLNFKELIIELESELDNENIDEYTEEELQNRYNDITDIPPAILNEIDENLESEVEGVFKRAEELSGKSYQKSDVKEVVNKLQNHSFDVVLDIFENNSYDVSKSNELHTKARSNLQDKDFEDLIEQRIESVSGNINNLSQNKQDAVDKMKKSAHSGDHIKFHEGMEELDRNERKEVIKLIEKL